MGSGTPPPYKPRSDAPSEGDPFSRTCSSGAQGASQLVDRIAEALQVSHAVLYQPPNAVVSVRGEVNDGNAAANLDQECAALLGAYQSIQDPAVRRQLLAVVEDAAERA